MKEQLTFTDCAYEGGRLAFEENSDRSSWTANPHTDGTSSYRAFEEGWMQAEIDAPNSFVDVLFDNLFEEKL